jgi:hypothetical protein
MAVEGPGLNLGYALAGDDFSSAAALDGPGGTGQFLAVVQSSTADLTMKLAGANVPIAGIIQNTPTIGQAADVRFLGGSKIVAGATITAGDVLMTDANGRGITHTTGHWAVGIALNNAAAAGVIIEALIQNFGSY